jgi:hypothetical protein
MQGEVEGVEQFKYLGTPLMNQNSIQEEIKSKLKSGGACYHSVQTLLSSSLQSWNVKSYDFACCFIWVWNMVAHTEGSP